MILYRIVVLIIKPILFLIHPYKVIGRENIPEDGGLVCSNHSSYYDPVFLALVFTRRRHLNFMAKADLLRKPVLGPLLKGIGVFGVERGKSDIGAIKTALSRLKDGKYVALYPEGTRVRGQEDAAAKTGAAMLALRTGVQVIPVYTGVKKPYFRFTKIVIGKPYVMQTEGKPKQEDYIRLSDELLKTIYDLGEQTWK